MKKYAFLFVVLFTGVAVAQVVTSNQPIPVTVNVPFSFDWVSWKVFLQQLATNLALAVATVLASKVPGIGELLRKVFDLFSANVKH